MHLETYTITLIIGMLSSAGFGMAFTAWGNRKKTSAETLLAKAQTKLTEIETYSTMLADMQTQLKTLSLQVDNYEEKCRIQETQMQNQAEQILNLQKKETQYLKIISRQNTREHNLNKRVKELSDEVATLKSQINE